jgi:ribosome-associated heat shock protein Hsp15
VARADSPRKASTAESDAAAPSSAGQRIDQWLWFARLTKSRTLAQALIEKGKVRINREKIARASHWLRVGDAVTISLGPRVRVFVVRAFAKRRGPAAEARSLYEELTPAADRTKPAHAVQVAGLTDAPATAVRDAGAGRPTKRERRAMERLKDRLRDH